MSPAFAAALALTVLALCPRMLIRSGVVLIIGACLLFLWSEGDAHSTEQRMTWSALTLAAAAAFYMTVILLRNAARTLICVALLSALVGYLEPQQLKAAMSSKPAAWFATRYAESARQVALQQDRVHLATLASLSDLSRF